MTTDKNKPEFQSPDDHEKLCGMCGSTKFNFLRSGKVKCAECYDIPIKDFNNLNSGQSNNSEVRLHDFYAAHALQGLLASIPNDDKGYLPNDIIWYVEHAHRLADEMVKESKRYD